MRKSLAAVAALALPLAFPAAASADNHTTSYVADLAALNDSGATGTAYLTLEGDQLTVEIDSSGVLAGSPHAQHIHFQPGTDGTCPPASADDDGNGIVSTPEGQPFYGGIQVALTTEGDYSPESGLAVDRMPTPDDSSIDYSRTIQVSQEVIDNLTNAVIVQHGIDVNDSGDYDTEALGESALAPGVPAEATTPINCGEITMAGAGGVGAGFGGTSGMESAGLVALGATAVAAGAGVLVVSRRRRGAEG